MISTDFGACYPIKDITMISTDFGACYRLAYFDDTDNSYFKPRTENNQEFREILSEIRNKEEAILLRKSLNAVRINIRAKKINVHNSSVIMGIPQQKND